MKNILKKIKSKGVPFQHVPFLLIFCAMMFSPAFIYAASISITGSTWALGSKGGSSETTSAANVWTVTNDSGGSQDVNIKVSSTGSWTASADATPTTNEFLLRLDSSSGQIITGTDGSLVTGLANAGTDSFGLYFKAPPVGSEDGSHTLTVTLTVTNFSVWTCGNNLTVSHATANGVAPVTKTVTYGTVLSSLSGASKCWITQNLGADNQSTAASFTTEAAAGWYWQFNRKQGFKHDGTTRTPTTTWITSISESSDWLAANDPCTIELGAGWRLPTSTEWTNAITNGSWVQPTPYSSVLKIHLAGDLNKDTGARESITYGTYWSSTQTTTTYGSCLNFGPSLMMTTDNWKQNGASVRCIKDWLCGESLEVAHTAGTTAPVTKTVTYGTVLSSLSGASKCWITQNLGATNQATAATDATEAAAGWYWQFNRKQGFKHDGTTRTPTTTWITSISESSDWLAANDPCT
ncbi:MAG: hypothetical protein PHU59_05565, partial [Candidatus Omnitrophica bacterium]|nr:hypothetical protein [Candidatus Omnitrophota bacterium]